MASGRSHIDLVKVLLRLALEIIGSARFSLEMKKYEGAADAALQLIRTRSIVDEALRLYPPAFVIVRQALAEDLVDGILVPARSLVLVAPLGPAPAPPVLGQTGGL